jgi:hypothetical protein
MNVNRTRGAALLACAVALGGVLIGCDLPNEDGKILEVETGRNGVKVEVKDGEGDYEVYLIPGTTCTEGTYLRDCADRDDYLVAPPGARAGLNGDDDRDD